MKRTHSSFVVVGLLLVTLVAPTLLGCAPSAPSASTKQIVNRDFDDWQAPADRIAAVEQWVAAQGGRTLAKTTDPEIRAIVVNQMAKVPPVVMQWLIQQKNFEIAFEGSGEGGGSGYCELGSPDSVRIGFQGAKSVFPTIILHELGHATQQWATSAANRSSGESIFPAGDDSWQAMTKSASENRQFSTYAKSYLLKGDTETFYYEAFAEAFDSYYFSAESNTYFQGVFPNVYGFMGTLSLAPAWLGESAPIGGGPPIGSGGNVGGETSPFPGVSPPQNPTPLGNSGIFVMVPETPSLNTIDIAADATIAAVSVCFDTMPQCFGGQAARVPAQRSQGPTDRAVFSVTIPPNMSATGTVPVAIMAMDASNNTVAKRQIVLHRNQ